MTKPVVVLALVFLAIYHANGRPHPEVDCIPAPYAAWSLVRHGSLDLRPYPGLRYLLGGAIQEMPDKSWVSRYPVGSTIAMLPFVAPLAAFRYEPLSDSQMLALGKFAAACFVAAASSLFFLTCRELAPSARWPATILFGLGTCLCSVASQAIWMHGPATFWLCVALWLLMRPLDLTTTGSIAAGFALGFAVITRPTTALIALATGSALLGWRRWSLAFAMALGAAIPLVILALMNWWQFGNPILGGYFGEYWYKPPPFWLGFAGLLVAPSRGVLVYSPALLVVPFGAAAIWRRTVDYGNHRRAVLLAWLVAAGATVLLYARWHEWKGGWCYGPRFLIELMPILCLAFAIGYNQLQKRWQRVVAVGLVALSVAVHLVGIFGYSGYAAWQERHDLPDHGRSLFALEDTQIEAHARACLRKVLGKTGNSR